MEAERLDHISIDPLVPRTVRLNNPFIVPLSVVWTGCDKRNPDPEADELGSLDVSNQCRLSGAGSSKFGNPSNTRLGTHPSVNCDGFRLELKSHCTPPETCLSASLLPDAHPPSCPSTDSLGPPVSSWGHSSSKPSSNTILSGSRPHRRYPPPPPLTGSLTKEGAAGRR